MTLVELVLHVATLTRLNLSRDLLDERWVDSAFCHRTTNDAVRLSWKRTENDERLCFFTTLSTV